jgi:hypothetical protein
MGRKAKGGGSIPKIFFLIFVVALIGVLRVALVPVGGYDGFRGVANGGEAGASVERLQRSVGGELARLHGSIETAQRLGGSLTSGKLTELEKKVAELENLVATRKIGTIAAAPTVVNHEVVTAVLLICYNRPKYLQRVSEPSVCSYRVYELTGSYACRHWIRS